MVLLELSELLKRLLIDNESICLPGMGCFVIEDVPSEFLGNGKAMTPPSKKISFKSSENKNDGLLIAAYAKLKDISESEAASDLSVLVRQIKKDLIEKAYIEIPNFGTIRFGEGYNFVFVADTELNVAPDSYGLETIALKTKNEAVTTKIEESDMKREDILSQDTMPQDVIPNLRAVPDIQSDPQKEENEEFVIDAADIEPVREPLRDKESSPDQEPLGGNQSPQDKGPLGEWASFVEEEPQQVQEPLEEDEPQREDEPLAEDELPQNQEDHTPMGKQESFVEPDALQVQEPLAEDELPQNQEPLQKDKPSQVQKSLGGQTKKTAPVKMKTNINSVIPNPQEKQLSDSQSAEKTTSKRNDLKVPAQKEPAISPQVKKALIILGIILGVVIVAIAVLVIFKDQFIPFWENLLYTNEELEILHRAGR